MDLLHPVTGVPSFPMSSRFLNSICEKSKKTLKNSEAFIFDEQLKNVSSFSSFLSLFFSIFPPLIKCLALFPPPHLVLDWLQETESKMKNKNRSPKCHSWNTVKP